MGCDESRVVIGVRRGPFVVNDQLVLIGGSFLVKVCYAL